jgi:hypothetical protein
MPSSLIVVALVVAWLVVLVPMIVRKRQEIARTADSALAARVVRSGGAEEVEEDPMRDDPEDVDEAPPAEEPLYEDAGEPRRYRPGRGGFDPEAAAVIARAKYSFRQRVVLAMIVGAVLSAIFAGIVFPLLWYAHGVLDLSLVSYLVYLRRQVRIEQEIRERRLARMRSAARIRAHQRPFVREEPLEEEDPPAYRSLASDMPAPPPRATHPGAAVLDVDDEDPAFDDLETPDNLPYRRAVGE